VRGARLVGVLGVRSRVVRGGCVWCWSCIGVLSVGCGCFLGVVYGREWGLVLVVVVLICVRIGFLCRFEG
jgi:hypothetical protein